ncbi:hypothetical protein [Paenibacillus campinasensis]|uniref:Uncharacterized protein n=1 Tax=Paenibacillus campinasensis TaxID=66347 RepID=A0A268ELA9_9BACL|nr:hypothetical protein [Paenibacillus campinasensis]PAD73894.1 hypothetical protein CHH67_18840 [Paenibacillus campinasensis]
MENTSRVGVTKDWISQERATELKLKYLNFLNGANMEINNVRDRISRVCDSIESDLGIKNEVVVDRIVVKISADTSELEEEIKRLSETTAEHTERIGNALKARR